MRLFISINFDSRTKDNILAVQQRLKEKGRGRFTTPDNLHLTLAFLGEVPEERVEDIKRIMDTLDVPQMKLNFNHTGCFRMKSKTSGRGSDQSADSELWWIGIEENKALSSLQSELARKLRAAGFSVEKKAFKPHITLARDMHMGWACSAELITRPFSTTAGTVSLMLSHRPDGRLTYTELYHTGK